MCIDGSQLDDLVNPHPIVKSLEIEDFGSLTSLINEQVPSISLHKGDREIVSSLQFLV